MANIPKYQILRSYHRDGDPEFEQLVDDVIAGLTDNPGFLTPPPSLAKLLIDMPVYRTAVTAMAQGGPADTAAKNQARVPVQDDVDDLADYVEGAANNNLALILSSGFRVKSTNRAQTPLGQPVIDKIAFGMSGELLVTMKAMANVHMFMVYAATDAAPNDFVLVGCQKSSRKISCTGLTPGVTYRIRVQALGGSTGKSPYSDIVLHISI